MECREALYWDFIEKNLLWLKEEEADIGISYDITTKISRLNELDASFLASITNGYNRLGYNLFVSDSSVICLEGNWLLWKYNVDENEKIHIDIYYSTKVDNFIFKSAKRLLAWRSAEEINRGRLLYLTRIAVHFPIFALLKTKENVGIIHAAAVEKDGKAIVLTGYDGVGKSTLALYLCVRKGFRYVSDNFLFYDEKYVYPCVESARLNEDSAIILGVPFTGNRIYGRIENQPEFYTKCSRLYTSAMFLNYFSNEAALENADQSLFANIILSMKDYLPEFIDFRRFLSVAKLCGEACGEHDDVALDIFLDNTRLYLLRKSKIEDIDEIAEWILKFI